MNNSNANVHMLATQAPLSGLMQMEVLVLGTWLAHSHFMYVLQVTGYDIKVRSVWRSVN